ncbi:helix-turn-helix transcriptional regulator [Methanolobus halotolerans]|uniref:Transcriptional regulator n=1 Tax=Methanolobus halotolerans TaxID=2052935 RepID=A0A4E0Q202_9EURY|nr:winged helix-turn-helix domain-containing protein [Methanolobus halotolerans]TGC06503.1 transcriptional regulator [Methanolobus halotolerans]
MKKALLDVLFKSDKRKDLLLLLQDGKKNMETILNKLNSNRKSLIPQIRILEEHHLVTGSKDVYQLTRIGKLVVNEINPLLDTVQLFDNELDYWGTHNLDFLPASLLKRLSELRKCNVINPTLTEMYSINKEFHEAYKKSGSLFVITTFLFPNFVNLFSELIGNNVTTYIIVSDDLLHKIRKDHYDSFKLIAKSSLINFYVYPEEMGFMSFGFNNQYLLMRLLRNNKEVDDKQLLCSGSDTIRWASDFFEYYLKDSIHIEI